MICSTKLQYIAWQGHNINQQNQPTNHLRRRGQVAWFNRRTMGCRLWEVLIWVVNAWLSHALALSIHPIAKVRPFFSFPKAVRAFTPTINVACEWALFWIFVSHLGPVSAPTPVSHVHTFLHIWYMYTHFTSFVFCSCTAGNLVRGLGPFFNLLHTAWLWDPSWPICFYGK